MKESREKLYEAVSATDGLAAERTFLAAERTLLAYLRAALTMFLVGVTGVRLLLDPVLITVAYLLAGASLLVFAFGVARYKRSEGAVRRVMRRLMDMSRR